MRAWREPGGKTVSWATLPLRVPRAGPVRKLTFLSNIDGSVQYYALLPARPEPVPANGKARKPGIVFTLHGAGVEAIGQAESTPPSRVCTSSHRRIAALMALTGKTGAGSMRSRCSMWRSGLSRLHPRRTYLTGHSMGGHGTWHLGVTFPTGLPRSLPGAGWISMWSYAGARVRSSRPPRSTSTRSMRATAPSDTWPCAQSRPVGVYVLHGDADDNVPVESSPRQMRQILGVPP